MWSALPELPSRSGDAVIGGPDEAVLAVVPAVQHAGPAVCWIGEEDERLAAGFQPPDRLSQVQQRRRVVDDRQRYRRVPPAVWFGAQLREPVPGRPGPVQDAFLAAVTLDEEVELEVHQVQ